MGVWLKLVAITCCLVVPVFAEEGSRGAEREAAPKPGDVNLQVSRVYTFVDKTGLGHQHAIEGKLVSGQLLLGATSSAGQLVFDMKSFDADTAAARRFIGLAGTTDNSTRSKVNANMKGADVLNVAKYPTATFDVQSAVATGKTSNHGLPTYQMTGNFTLHGTTKMAVDVGCGMGGSAIHLAKQRGCNVTGVTLSPFQRGWAAMTARLKRRHHQTRFLTADAERVQFDQGSFDVVWSVECTEHLFDKPGFFQNAADWLRPGGRLAICVWFEGEDTSQTGHREQVEEVCRRFVCPSLGTRKDYVGWITDSGLTVRHDIDWTQRAAKTWEICKRRVSRSGVRYLAGILDKDQVAFIDGFDTLLSAYRSGAMQYGAIVAEKPLD